MGDKNALERPRRSSRRIQYQELNKTGKIFPMASGGMEQQIVDAEGINLNAPVYDDQIDSTAKNGARRKTPSAAQIPVGTVSKNVKIMETPSSKKSTKQKVIQSNESISDETLAEMDDEQFNRWKEEYEQSFVDKMKQQQLENRRWEIEILQKARQVAMQEMDQRDKELEKDWSDFEKIQLEIRADGEKGRNI